MRLIKAVFKLVFGIILLLFVAVVVVGVFTSDDDQDEKPRKDKTDQTASQACGDANRTGVEYVVSGSSINIRNGPGTQYDKIVNRKATEVLGETIYVQIDHTVTVHEFCRKGDWSYIQVDKPDWLRKSHRGWVASRYLRKDERDDMGVRVFTEADFIWDKNIAPYKDIIIAGVNKIHRENIRCKEIDTSSAYISGTRSTPGGPVFFVTCGSGANAFNVWFSKKDLESGKVFRAAKHIDRGTAIDLCEQYAKKVATHPSTVDFSRFLDLSVREHPNGRTTITSTFTAKNSFNLKIEFRIRCLLDATSFIEASVQEVG